MVNAIITHIRLDENQYEIAKSVVLLLLNGSVGDWLKQQLESDKGVYSRQPPLPVS